MWFQADVITIGPKGLVNASMENITILFLHILNMQSSETTCSFHKFHHSYLSTSNYCAANGFLSGGPGAPSSSAASGGGSHGGTGGSSSVSLNSLNNKK